MTKKFDIDIEEASISISDGDDLDLKIVGRVPKSWMKWIVLVVLAVFGVAGDQWLM